MNENTSFQGTNVEFFVSLTPMMNYALQQNHVPTIRTLSIINRSEEGLKDVTLRATAGELCLPVERHIDFIPPQSTLEIKGFDVHLNSEYLAGLTEKVTGMLTLALFDGETQLYTENHEMTALAYDEWHGSSFCPEMVAAFVTPNHPEVTKIIQEATTYLNEWTGDPTWSAYSYEDPNRVIKQVAAIYTALQQKNIVYAIHPASFESMGQRIRTPDTIMSQRMACCMDFTVLFASCLEQVGIHPLLLFEKEHVFTGFWLERKTFPDSVSDDSSIISKRLAVGNQEIEIFETTMLSAGRNMSFEQACAYAHKSAQNSESIVNIVDIHRARLSGITPLPSRVMTSEGWQFDFPTPAPRDSIPTTRQEKLAIDLTPKAKEDEPVRKVQWERKLLDLGLRNTLVNMRLTKSVIPILTDSLDDLEDALADGNDFSILKKPDTWKPVDGKIDPGKLHILDDCKTLIREDFKRQILRSALTESELASSLKYIYRAAKVALEENGANALYLALGLLRWYETERSVKERYAPLIMIPVEIIRRSAEKGYAIRLRDDEPQFNITLLEKLSQEFKITIPGLDPLPRDEHGVNTRRIFATLREALMEQKRWDVLESAYLGTFSFSQFVMWNDIHNRSDDFAKNKIVGSLLDGKLTWDAESMSLDEQGLEKNLDNRAFLPLSTDASQQYAVEATSRGTSFVLHGPPGTGKSQTITCMIANALAQGKTVLFVAEKMAALSVVEKRLAALGIGPFCLELHSNKSTKRDVLNQLQEVTEVIKTRTSEEFLATAQELARVRTELDAYASELHAERPSGMSLFRTISEYEDYGNILEKSGSEVATQATHQQILYTLDFASTLTPQTLSAMRENVKQMVIAGQSVGHPANHVLHQVTGTEYSQRMKFELPTLLDEYESVLSQIETATLQFASAVGRNAPKTMQDYQNLRILAQEMALWSTLPQAWKMRDDMTSYAVTLREEIKKCAQLQKNTERLKTELSHYWKESFFTLDGVALVKEYQTKSSQWLLPRFIDLFKLTRRMKTHMSNPVNKTLMGTHFIDLREYQQSTNALKTLLQKMNSETGLIPKTTEANRNWQSILTLCPVAEKSLEKIRKLPDSEQIRHNLLGNETYQTAVAQYLETLKTYDATWEKVNAILRPNLEQDGSWIEAQRKLCATVRTHSNKLKDWTAWNAVAEKARSQNLAQVVNYYMAGAPSEAVLPAFLRSIYKCLIILTIDSSPVLSRFSATTFNEKIEYFRTLDTKLMRLTQEEIFCRLASKVPNFTKEAAKSSDLGILQRAIRSGGRGLSIRNLFEQIPNLLPRLCPCMLMSPISVAQYLAPSRTPFDIVIIDEASQLPTCKAVGALVRGREAVVVGDPKQMPPTSFFATNSTDEENWETEDLESILDDCLALSMPETHLLWHYRSRHESLIAFSNRHFYDNRLLTFPSVNDRESKVTLVHVAGSFDRGNTRQNRAEAEAVVADICERCHDPERNTQSVGVVTFNVSQQGLIDDLLMEACRADATLDEWVRNQEEPLFIKNLENVQGDERDVILFSIGYGADSTGKVSMNFGPLNRDGGWRRLNVAISRSRYEMKVFSSLLPEQIDLNRTNAEGVVALKAFLEYATGIPLGISENGSAQHKKLLSGVGAEICERLQKAGYRTTQLVGHSGYRIDIGVVDPHDENRYLLGILLDGPCYAEAKTTRDREMAQIQVLRGLGWNILRVWSLDWWDNPDKEMERVLAELRTLETMPKQEKITPTPAPKISTPPKTFTPPKPSAPPAISTPPTIPTYKTATLSGRCMDADEFLATENQAEIQSRIREVLRVEAPIFETVLTRRVVQSFGILRHGNRIQTRMTNIYKTLNLTYSHDDNTGEKVFWGSLDPQNYTIFRLSGTDDERRDTREIPLIEAQNAVCYVLEEQLALSENDLIREAAKAMGYVRLTSGVTQLFQIAMEKASHTGKIVLSENGTWILNPATT